MYVVGQLIWFVLTLCQDSDEIKVWLFDSDVTPWIVELLRERDMW